MRLLPSVEVSSVHSSVGIREIFADSVTSSTTSFVDSVTSSPRDVEFSFEFIKVVVFRVVVVWEEDVGRVVLVVVVDRVANSVVLSGLELVVVAFSGLFFPVEASSRSPAPIVFALSTSGSFPLCVKL